MSVFTRKISAFPQSGFVPRKHLKSSIVTQHNGTRPQEMSEVKFLTKTPNFEVYICTLWTLHGKKR